MRTKSGSLDLEANEGKFEKRPIREMGGKLSWKEFKREWKGKELESMDIDNSFEFCMMRSRKQMAAEEGCGMREGVFVVVVF